ncbi:galactokinase [Gordonia shandongensis]|uniref:galactokinase n=1 Tax=Gordonia shandongensis TaxID=376351 RepID=UPI000412572E|nr:galactokinase [Gordonia shandongensis]
MSPATVRAFAPGRVNLIGEHTDYNLGFALPIALDLGTLADFTPDDGDAVRASSATAPGSVVVPLDTEPGGVDGWGAYVAGCVWALRTAGVPVRGGDLRIDSEVPVGSGLSSSAALECSVLLALVEAARAESTGDGGRTPTRMEVARLAQRAENEYVGAPTGLLDQLSSLFGQRDRALLLDFRTAEVTPVPVATDGAHRLLVIDSRAPHRNVAGEYGERRASCAAAADHLGVETLRDAAVDDCRRLADPVEAARARHVLTENQRVLAAVAALRAADHRAFGALMTESHASMRDDFQITTDHIDYIVATATRLGALGARMTGGGFGGSVVALAETAVADRIIADLPAAVTAAGFPEPVVRAVRPGAGAHLR